MRWACADNKGCYTGQEIIARQVTYDKVTKSLAGLVCESAVNIGDEVSVGGESAGKVTSVAFSPRLGRYIALAILRRPHNAVGTKARVGTTTAQVVELPFV